MGLSDELWTVTPGDEPDTWVISFDERTFVVLAFESHVRLQHKRARDVMRALSESFPP